jgi:glycosyltransferase involved in cell wall biosynthesis
LLSVGLTLSVTISSCMTILFFSRLFYPHIGGVETHALQIGKMLVKYGHKVVVVTEKYSWSDTDSVEGIQIYRMPVGKENRLKKFRVWVWLWKQRQLITQADIIHCHDVFFWYLPFRFIFPNKPVYTTFHGHEMTFPPSKKAILVRKISEKLSWGNICVGAYIQKWYGTKPTFVTDGAIETVKESHLKKMQGKIKIVFIGRLEPDTGVPLYLHLLDIVKSKHIDFSFEACGDGSLRELVKQYGIVHGFVQNVPEYINDADIVFASSQLSIMEAFLGKRIVFAAYENALKKDLLSLAHFGKWIILSDNPSYLADQVIAVMNNPLAYKNQIENAYQWVKTQTWRNLADLYTQLWQLNSH